MNPKTEGDAETKKTQLYLTRRRHPRRLTTVLHEVPNARLRISAVDERLVRSWGSLQSATSEKSEYRLSDVYDVPDER